jgi:oligoribonuclease NrnB/cAMP/cGMP phosphodiesterase (DHH superfamily)
MGCCDDPTEPVKINRTDVARIQEQHGNLVRDLFTSDPEKVILKQLNEASAYLRELAALNAHYDSVRKRAIELLKKDSIPILQRIIDKEPESELGQCALQRVKYLKEDHSLFRKIFN